MQRLILVVLSLFFVTSPALAKADKWVVSQRSGEVRVVHVGLQPVSVTVKSTLVPGDIVITGVSGRATLTRGTDYIIIAPKSELRLPTATQAGGFTRVVQRVGTMLFKIKHTGVPHFAVDTPMLAAVVKGTTFTVVVDRDRSAVQVVEGAVEVTASDGGMRRLVEGGHTVFIDHVNPKDLVNANAQTLGAREASSTAVVRVAGSQDESLVTVANLTGGLVQAETVTTAAAAPVIVSPTAAVTASTEVNAPGEGSADIGSSNGVVTPIAAPIEGALPIVETVVSPITIPVADVIAPITGPIVDVVAPITTPIVEGVVTPIVAPVVNTVVAPVVTPIIAPVVAPIVQVVSPTVAPVVAPIVAPVAPVVAPILGPVSGLIGLGVLAL